ncbi:YodL domain-containing protein [Lachnospiraceae bacterium 42-17]
MASLRDAVKDYQDELRAGIAWVAFWREGRSWNSDYIYLETDDTLTPEDRGRLQEIQAKDPAAVVLNGYYCGYLGEDMNLDGLTAGVRRHYENSYNNIADFIEAHDDRLPPEVIEEAREAAHAAGLPFSEKPYRDGDFDPYVFDGSMSIEDYDLMHRMMNEERSKRMSETFSVLIDSRSRFETGQPGGVWLSMPTTTEQLHEAMKSIGITADNPQDFFINGFANTEEYPFDVPLPVIQRSTIDELNYLGNLLIMQSDNDRDKFTAAVTLGEHAGSVKDLINLAQNLDCYWIYPTVRSEADYGYYLIDELDELELPEEAKKYFKYEEYGRDAVKKDRGQFTEQGYIYNNGNTFSQWYNGRESDIPQEYKAMSFPEPERPDPDKLEKDEAAPGQEAAEPQPQPQPRPVNPIILTADKPAEKLKEITDRLEQGITELFDSERYKEYLQVMSKFHNYSFNNTLLIAMQKPDASLIAGFNAWKNNFGRNVMRGEKGIRILAPSPYKIRQEVEKKDPQTGKTVIGGDGKPVTETKEIQIPAYKVVAVFDVSQTEGRELPSISANELTGDVEQYEDFFAALEKTSPVPMGFEKIEGTAHGYYHLEEKRIAIDEGMSELQNLKTAIHEIAHAKLHDIDLNAPQEEQADRPDRRTREVQAESIAYTVCQHYGLDTSDYSFGYVAGWSSGRELAELKSSLETIRATAAEIINSIDGHFAELQKEREAAKEQAAEAQTPPDLTAEPTVTILWSESSQLREGETIPLSRANTLIEALDEANLESPGYDKTEFRIDFVMNGKADQYEGRQDLGDGEGALIEHIEKYHAYYANDPYWNNFLLQHEGKEALEADKEHRAFLLNEFVPYLKLHCNLSEMERIAGEALQKDNLTPTETAYHTAMQAYVFECRGLINQGEYNLPPVPQLKDFDVELEAYKEHVKEEIAQEAAAAGMTVEEYAANGYEPYAAPEPEAAQTAEPQEPEKPEAQEKPQEPESPISEKADTPEQAEPAATEAPQTSNTEQPETSVTYYPISEAAAKRAKEAISYSDYKPGSATAEYRHYVDEAAELAARQKKRVDPSFHAKIDGLLDTYARKLAANMNKGYEITARVPSILITGGSNFPVRKKEKQNAAADKNMQEFNEIQGLLDKIRSTGMGGISADDPDAVSKLESKLAKLETLQETMKAVNAYYRKNKTLDGCPHLSTEQIEKLKASMSGSYRANPKPFESYQLSNNNAEIHRLKDRITALTRRKELGYVGWEFDGGRVEANTADNRLQIFFDEKPDKEIREELKGNGFRYAPSAEAWQRQLNDNAIYAADRIQCIQPLTGERPTELQKRARQEAAAQKQTEPEQPQEAAQDTEPGDAATPETFCKVRQNPYSDSRENSHILQEYIAQDNGMAKLGDILYMGTPEKCRELLGKLEAGELTQGDVKELYAKAQEAQPTAEPGQETPEPATPGKEPDKDTFTIYQLKDGDGMRDYHFEPYDRLQAAGLAVETANYNLIYTAELTPGTSLEDIYTRFNIDHPADFRGHSLSVSDIVVLHQNGQDTAHYVDSFGYKEVPEFLQEQTQQLTPDTRMTGEQIRTPRGSFSVTDMTAEQMRAAGYGLHHTSEDGKYLIMGNGTQAFAVAAEQREKANPLKHVEDTIEQNDNNFDGIINNTPTTDELEAKARSGEQISLSEYAAALKAEQEQGKEKKPGKKAEKKPSIRAQLKADKERAAQKKQTRSKSQDLERS